MLGRKLAATLLAVLLGAGVGACGTDDTGDQDPGQFSEEDPTLGDPEGGGTSDTDDQTRDDGGDEGTTPNSATDSGSGTGAGRGDG
jgi:hypothetical protein